MLQLVLLGAITFTAYLLLGAFLLSFQAARSFVLLLEVLVLDAFLDVSVSFLNTVMSASTQQHYMDRCERSS